MKKYIYLIVLALILSLVLTGCSLLSNISQVPATEQTKVKPDGNLAGAQTYAWHLSADVLPVPPYGSMDIAGSDTASKLIVNQPNGNTEVTITGVMNGLNPNTTYTVILSNEYTPYVFTGWNVTGSWIISVDIGGTDYPESTIFLQTGGSIPGSTELTGTLLYGSSLWTLTEGSVIESAIDFHAIHEPALERTVHFWGTIAADGTMSGDWADDPPYTRSGPWASTSGTALETHIGNTGWSGAFYNYPRFTFLTDADGAGSWHLNLRDEDFDGARDYTLSVWINVAGKTTLLSDNFTVEVD